MEKLMVLIASSDNIMYNYKEMHEVFPFVKVNTSRKLREEMIVQITVTYNLILPQVLG